MMLVDRLSISDLHNLSEYLTSISVLLGEQIEKYRQAETILLEVNINFISSLRGHV